MNEKASQRKFVKNEILHTPNLIWDLVKRGEYFEEITESESRQLTTAIKELQIKFHGILDKEQKTLTKQEKDTQIKNGN
jgi:hypothetical protein